MPENATDTRCGFIAAIGAPNAGKSTLVNALVGAKVSIVSRKVQTTRMTLRGIAIEGPSQLVFIDTPGIFAPRRRLDRAMVDAAWSGAVDADQLMLVVDAAKGVDEDVERILGRLKDVRAPVLLVLNKVDLVAKPKLLPLMERYGKAHPFAEIVPVSAVDGTNVDVLERLFLQYLPEGAPLYPADYLTDQPERVLAAELVREQVLRLTHAELPFSTAVVIDRFEEPGDHDKVLRLYCTILVDRESQKGIVIGKGGAMIKAIGTAARLELERVFGTKVFLDLHVKVSREWRDDERLLDDIGLR